jgi:hypothetical protein
MDKFSLLLYSQCSTLLALPAISSADQCLLTLPRLSGGTCDVNSYRDELCRVATEMMNTSPGHPTAWSCAALYTDLKGEKEKAMQFIDKVSQSLWFTCQVVLNPALSTHPHRLGHLQGLYKIGTQAGDVVQYKGDALPSSGCT